MEGKDKPGERGKGVNPKSILVSPFFSAAIQKLTRLKLKTDKHCRTEDALRLKATGTITKETLNTTYQGLNSVFKRKSLLQCNIIPVKTQIREL